MAEGGARRSVHVATAFDAGYAPFGAALLASMGASLNPRFSMVLHVLHPVTLDRGQRRAIEAVAQGVALHWHEVRPETSVRHGVRMEGVLSAPAYYRCLLPDLIQCGPERVLYLDADTLVLQDLVELYHMSLGGAPVAAVQDWLPTVADAIEPWRKLELDGSAPYFNSGVMLVDLAAWRQEDAGGRTLRRCLSDQEHLVVRGVWPQHDQYGLNVVFHRRWKAVRSDYNHFTELPGSDPTVLHFVGNGKPWSPRCRPEHAARFREFLALTPWPEWTGPRSCTAARST